MSGPGQSGGPCVGWGGWTTTQHGVTSGGGEKEGKEQVRRAVTGRLLRWRGGTEARAVGAGSASGDARREREGDERGEPAWGTQAWSWWQSER